jgi:hypothetical protein
MFRRLFIAAAAVSAMGLFGSIARAQQAEYRYVRVMQAPSRYTFAMVRQPEKPARPYALTGERAQPDPRPTYVWAGPKRIGIHMLPPERVVQD